MTKKYIDAELVKKELNRGNANIGLFNYLIAVIESTPAADVEEVKHGEWEMIPPPKKHQAGAYVKFRCSECGIEFESSSKYCRCCGARMDGKKKR